MALYLVTGGAGFIGSHLTEELTKRGESVRVIDNFITGKKENLTSFLDCIEFIEGDIRDLELCRQAAQGVDYVLHQAALPSVPRSVADPLTTNEINIRGTLNLLLASRDAGVKKFVFASSSSVYGDHPSLPKKEGEEGSPLSPYALTKMVGEKYCLIFHRIYNLPTVSLRYFNIFGPRQDPHSQYSAVIPRFITRMLEGKEPVIFGDGQQSRDFTFVRNVVEANILAAGAADAAGGAVNIACGEKTTVNDLAAKINEILGSDVKPVHDSPRPGDIRHSFADISKAQELLRYTPLVSFAQGLEKTINWYRERK
ncbi:MAG: SDR family oxidoreductase [Candidatus Aminicenantales bacterium]